jgi:hypothetical protein
MVEEETRRESGEEAASEPDEHQPAAAGQGGEVERRLAQGLKKQGAGKGAGLRGGGRATQIGRDRVNEERGGGARVREPGQGEKAGQSGAGGSEGELAQTGRSSGVEGKPPAHGNGGAGPVSEGLHAPGPRSGLSLTVVL